MGPGFYPCVRSRLFHWANRADKDIVESSAASDGCLGEDTVDEYVRHRLTPAEAAAFERHLLECEHCVEELRETRAIVQALRDAAPILLPPHRSRRRLRVVSPSNSPP
jgi:anti-sigma factor RsiW